jgi:hypothetical protein
MSACPDPDWAGLALQLPEPGVTPDAPAFFRSAVSRRRCLVVTKNKVRRNGQLGFGLFNERHAPNVGCDLAVRRPFRRMRSSRKLKHRGMLADA